MAGSKGGGGRGTGNCAMMDWNWAGARIEESRRYSSSVRMVERERVADALSVIVFWGWGEEGGMRGGYGRGVCVCGWDSGGRRWWRATMYWCWMAEE